MTSRAEKFADLERLTNEALKLAYDDRGAATLKNDPVNWADLSCRYVEWYEDSFGLTGYRVHIEEAAPGCGGLMAMVSAHLKAHGHDDAEVETAW